MSAMTEVERRLDRIEDELKSVRMLLMKVAGWAKVPPEHESALVPDSIRPMWQIERDAIQRALRVCNGDVQESARRLEISPATLYRRIQEYELIK